MIAALRLTALVAVSATILPAQEDASLAEELAAIVELQQEARGWRGDGKFEEAVEKARQALAAIRALPNAPSWYEVEVADFTARMEAMAAMGSDARDEMAEAERQRTAAYAGWTNYDYAASIAPADRVCELLSAHFPPDDFEVLEARIFRAENNIKVGRIPQARVESEEVLALLRARHPESGLTLMAVNLVCDLAPAYGEVDRGLELAREAHAAWQRMGVLELPVYRIDAIDTIQRLADLLERKERFDDAAGLHREFLEHAERFWGTESYEYAVGLNNYGLCAFRSGQYGRCRALWQEALAIKLAVLPPAAHSLGMAYMNLGDVLHKIGDLEGAGEALRSALAIFEEGLPGDPLAANTMAALAQVEYFEGEEESALVLAENALGLGRRALGDDHETVLKLIALLARLHLERGDFAEAEARAVEYLENQERVNGMTSRLAPGYLMLGLAAVRRGDLDSAEEAMLCVNECVGENVGLDVFAVGATTLLGELHARRGDLAKAEANLVQAAEIYERIRSAVDPGVERSLIAGVPYASLADVRARRGDADGAWAAQERSRGRSVHELLFLAGQDSEEREELGRLDAEAHALESRRTALAGAPSAAALRRELEGEALRVAARIAALRRELEERSVVAGEGTFELARVQATLRADEAVIGWLYSDRVPDAGSWIWVVRSSGSPQFVRSAAGHELGAVTRALRDALAEAARSPFPPRPGAHDDLAEELRGALVAPAEAALEGVRHLIVVPSGPALGLPLEAILDGFTISYAPSSSVYGWLLEREPRARRERRGPALFVGDPPFEAAHAEAMDADERAPAEFAVSMRGSLAKLQRLEASRREVELAGRHFEESRTLLGIDADERVLDSMARSDELGDFRVLHLATHALVDDRDPGRSALVLSQVGLPRPLEAALRNEPAFDGVLTAREVVSTWNLDADLVTLSACKTGLGRPVPGEGYVGLAQAFLEAGARSLIVSLWSVEDRATGLFMERFYAHWVLDDDLGPRPKAEALARARRDLREYEIDGARPFAHPAHWAAFVLIGDPR